MPQPKTSQCQFSLPIASNTPLLTNTTPTTPHAYTECNRLMARSGSGEGIAAMIGLISTSDSPPDAAKTIVPNASPA